MNKPKKKEEKSKEDLLQELILQQGLILESEVFYALQRHYALRFNSASKISYTVANGESTQEVDVFAAISKDSQSISSPHFNSVSQKPGDMTLEQVMNILLIECKGHSSDGILLGRKHHQTANDKILFKNHVSFYEYVGRPIPEIQGNNLVVNSPGRWSSGYAERTVGPIVDSCVFYDKHNQAYSESKKLYKGVGQIMLATKLFDYVLDQWHRPKVENIRAFTVTPIICTNVPITVMDIKNKEVQINEFEWAFMINPDFGIEERLPNRPDLRLVPIVQLSSLTKFCDSIMTTNLYSSLVIDPEDSKVVHSFDIEQARKKFKEDTNK